MAFEAHLWARPECESQLDYFLGVPGAPAKSSIDRSFAVLDALVARWRAAELGADILSDFRPEPLARLSIDPSLLTWPATEDGIWFGSESLSIELCMFQVGRLRSAVAIVVSREEVFVVWLEAHLTGPTREDGFVDDEDAALAQQDLQSKLERLVNLSWLEAE